MQSQFLITVIFSVSRKARAPCTYIITCRFFLYTVMTIYLPTCTVLLFGVVVFPTTGLYGFFKIVKYIPTKHIADCRPILVSVRAKIYEFQISIPFSRMPIMSLKLDYKMCDTQWRANVHLYFIMENPIFS